jgi:hypothetical protein
MNKDTIYLFKITINSKKVKIDPKNFALQTYNSVTSQWNLITTTFKIEKNIAVATIKLNATSKKKQVISTLNKVLIQGEKPVLRVLYKEKSILNKEFISSLLDVKHTKDKFTYEFMFQEFNFDATTANEEPINDRMAGTDPLVLHPEGVEAPKDGFENPTDGSSTDYITALKDLKLNFNSINSVVLEHSENIRVFSENMAYTKEVLNDLRTKVENPDTSVSPEIAYLKENVIGIREMMKRQTDLFNTFQNKMNETSSVITDLKDKMLELERKVGSGSTNLGTGMHPTAFVSSLYSGLVNDLQLAQDSVANKGFQLSNLNIDLKTVIADNGSGQAAIRYLDASNPTRVPDNMVSNISMQIGATSNEPKSNVTIEKVPSVKGMTESLAQKTLMAKGLRLQSIYENNPDVPSGAAFKQYPAADSEIVNNDTVTVIFSSI